MQILLDRFVLLANRVGFASVNSVLSGRFWAAGVYQSPL